MSKGSLFFGHARGKLGQVVLSTVKGQQIARAWQPKVANPRTTAQQSQRAKFANAVKFYRRATSNLFNFAFEDKKKTESDYNAFMRHNVDRAMIVNRASYDNIAYPAMGYNWQMSAGSLGDITPELDGSNSKRVYLSSCPLNGSKDPGDLTVADVSKDIIKYLGAVEGDYITLVGISSSITSINDEPTTPPAWGVGQFQIDTSNELDKPLGLIQAQVGEGFGPSISKIDENNFFTATNGEACAWLAVILSRVTSSGVLVSTSELAGNGITIDVYQASVQLGYRSSALNSWDRKNDPILKGSIIKESQIK